MKKIITGTVVKTLIDKYIKDEKDNKILIPKGTEGLVCEVNTSNGKDWAYVEIWGDDAPLDVEGVFGYSLDKLEIINK